MRKLLICLLIIFLSSAFITSDRDCSATYEKVLGYYQKYMKDKMYFRFSTQTITNNQTGENLINEIWLDGRKLKYNNKFMTVFQDEKNSVMISRENRLILISKIENKSDIFDLKATFAKPFHPDSLKKMSSLLLCEENSGVGKMILKLKDEFARKLLIRSVEIDYNSQKKEVLKGTYDIYGQQGWHKEVYEYLSYSETFDPAILSGAATEKVLVEGKLRKEYSGYTLRDLR